MKKKVLFVDGQTVTAMMSMALGGAIAIAVLVICFGSDRTNFADAAALGAETTSVFAKSNGVAVHCSDSRNAADCLEGQKIRQPRQAALWLGNSQLDSVNQWRPLERNAPSWLFDSMSEQGIDLLTFSQPNASLQEHYVLFEYLRERMPLKLLLLPVVCDDLREEGLREEIALLARNESVAQRLGQSGIGKRLAQAAQTQHIDDETAGIAATLQEDVERKIVSWLSDNSQVWQARPAVRGSIFLGLYRLRNFVFGIDPSTKRRMIPGRYRDNLSALNQILDVARQRDIVVVLYIPPLRNDVEIPYVASEYQAFKQQVQNMARRPGVLFRNFEDLVPPEYWGSKDSTSLGQKKELDFMHFQAGGHKLLADALSLAVKDAIRQPEYRQ